MHGSGSVEVHYSVLSLSRIDATSAAGAQVPLSQFASITSTVAPIAINHQGQFPSVTLSFIGIILLIGIVKKNGIMLVDFALVGQRERGLSSEEAIHEACRLRFRPILMTTMCALLAGVPLMLGTGIGSENRQPLGYAIVGGLLVSQVLTLFTTPVVYIYMDRLGNWAGAPPPRHRCGSRYCGMLGAHVVGLVAHRAGTMGALGIPCAQPCDCPGGAVTHRFPPDKRAL